MSKITKLKRKKTNKKTKKGNVDFILLFSIILLVLFGLVMVFSSSYNYALMRFGNMFYTIKRQMMWAGIGFVFLIITSNIKYDFYKKVALPGYFLTVFLLVLVLIRGNNINGATRWLTLGGISFQPSELAKITMVILISYITSKNMQGLKEFSNFLIILLFIFIPVGLIFIENISTSLVVFLIGLSILFVAVPNLKHLYKIGIITLLLILMVIPFLIQNPRFKKRISRFKAWVDPFEQSTGRGYQTVQSLYAVGSGGFLGYGLGQSKQKEFIPEASNDMIFAIISEELGFIGAFIIVILYMIIIWRGILIATYANSCFGAFLAIGITMTVGIQAFINIAVVTNLVPVTGMALPLISYGGTSLVALMASLGILLNISKYTMAK